MNPTSPLNLADPAKRQAAVRLEEFRKLRARGALCTEVSDQFATQAATTFLDHYRRDERYLADAITLLAEIATLEEPCLAEPGQRATFPLLVEQLSDSFDPQSCLLYDRVFAQMISLCRQLPAAQPLDRALRAFGLVKEPDLLERKAELRKRAKPLDAESCAAVRKALILSRVTLGADVAVTSVVLQKARNLFPQAERVLLGPAKAAELFGGDSTLRIRNVSYPTEGGLLDRLLNWLPVMEAVEEETRGLAPEEYILLDPDSRLLQLGLLPAVRDQSRYFFFESRRIGPPSKKSVSQLTLDWLNETFGGQDEILPRLWLGEQDLRLGQEVGRRLRQAGARKVVAVSYGVGGNQSKRLPDSFEEQLLMQLMEDGCTVVFDKGTGEEEFRRANRWTERVRASGCEALEIDAATAPDLQAEDRPLECRMLTWQGGIGAWAGLIASSDEYIGYDSAGQHIAAALGVPTVDIFAESAAPIFRQRWRPTGNGIVKVVAVGDFGNGASALRATLSEVMNHHREIQRAGSGFKK